MEYFVWIVSIMGFVWFFSVGVYLWEILFCYGLDIGVYWFCVIKYFVGVWWLLYIWIFVKFFDFWGLEKFRYYNRGLIGLFNWFNVSNIFVLWYINFVWIIVD